ncbi:MAG: TonB-dependent receptor domain-containing protein, partial [Steroidobacter sp.]
MSATFYVTGVMGLVLFGSAAATIAQESTQRLIELDIRSQPLTGALNQWAQQTGFNLITQVTDVTDRVAAPPIKGALTAKDALVQLLDGTSLTYRHVNERTIAIRERVQATPISVDGLGTVNLRQSRLHLAHLTDDSTDVERMAQAHTPGADRATSAAADRHSNEQRERVRQIEEIIVTGTHIRGVSDAPGNLIVIDRGEIARSGFGNLSQVISSLPQSFGGGASQTVTSNMTRDGSQFNQSVGTGINLRGLGTGATLTLLNGHRLAPAGQGTFVDISLIPLSAIDHIEVLTDGASAVYGSDAIGGVVNIITNGDFTGAETTLRYGSVTSGSRQEYTIGQAIGGSWESGNIILNYEHTHEDPLPAAERSFSQVAANGPYDLLVEQVSNSLLASIRQEISSRVDVTADVLASRRDFEQRSTPFTNSSRGSGHTTGVGTSAAIQVELGSTWQAELAGTYSQNTLDKRTEIPDFLFDERSKSDYETMSLEARADGDLLRLPAGAMKLAVGASLRTEDAALESLSGTPIFDGDRDISSVFAELHVPLMGGERTVRGAETLDLSIAWRFDDYSDFGSTNNPRFALLWSPLEGVIARGTYSRSFRAPLFFQTAPGSNHGYIFDVLDPNSVRPDGLTTAAIYDGGNPGLEPETARSWTAGLELRPSWAPDSSLRLNYFDIDYKGRVIQLVDDNFVSFLLDEAALSSFIIRNPSATSITDFVNSLPLGVDDFNQGNFGRTDAAQILADYTFGA